MKRTVLLSLATLLVASAALNAASVNLVTNGSFEQGTLGIGSFQGWQTSLGDTSTFVDSSGQTGTKYGQATDGVWAAYFGSTGADGGASILEALSTSVNQRYLLSFDLANDNASLAPLNSFLVFIGNATAFSFNNAPNQNFVHYQFQFVASSNLTPLTFAGSNDNSYFELDNVSVVAVPEPSMAAMLFVGLLGTGTLLGLRKRLLRAVPAKVF